MMNTMIRWNPRTRSVIDRFFEDAWRNWAEDEHEVRDARHALAVDVHEDEGHYFISTVIPGVNPDAINVRLHEGVLTIEASVEETTREENQHVLVQERRYGTFARRLRLPDQAEADAIEARYENGVLTLTIPKAEEAQPKHIRVKVSKN